MIAVNDISILIGFTKENIARKALVQFGNLGLKLRSECVSKVNETADIINSHAVHKALEIAPRYSLIQALNDIKSENQEQFLCILQILTMVGEDAEDQRDEFSLLGYRSTHCARYKKDFLLSVVSDKAFASETVTGILNDEQSCEIRNIAYERHIDLYWKELGFRLYEINPKHGKREYIRAGGERVGIAPETDELGQKLLNHAIEYKGKLFSVDRENRIFEFRHSYANKFHGFLQENLQEDDRKKIIAANIDDSV